MRSRANILTSLVMICALFGTYGVAAHAATLKDAHTVYFNQYETSPAGIIVDSGIVFSTVILPYSQNASKRSVRTKAMLAAGKQLIEHYALPSQQSSTGSKSLDQALLRQRDIRLNKLPSRVLVNRQEGDQYRYVLAVEESHVKKILSGQIDKSVSASDVITVLQQMDMGAHYSYLSQVLSELGLPEIALQWQKKELAKEINLTNYYQPSRIPFHERKKVQELLADATPGLDWLYDLPASPIVIEYHLKHNDLSAAEVLAFESIMLPALESQTYQQAQKKWSQGELNYLPTLSREQSLESPYKAVQRFPGHIWFGLTFSDQPTPAFVKAKALFERGVELDKIITLLKEGINLSPRHSESWQYLGAAFIAKEQWQEAAVAYLQWIVLQPDNIEAVSRFAESLYRMGLKNESARFIPYLRFYSDTNTFAKNSLQLIEKK